jgi:chromosome condensin MukBEF ATPase and DNA-binding subunit MukB
MATETWRSRGVEVGAAFTAKLLDTQTLVDKIKDTIKAVDEHIFQLRKVDSDLEAAVLQRQEKLNITEACMRKRTERPTRERVRDAVETLLEDEYALLDRALHDLADARAAVSEKQRALTNLRSQLMLDLQDKQQALRVDQRIAAEYHQGTAPHRPPSRQMNPIRPGSADDGPMFTSF